MQWKSSVLRRLKKVKKSFLYTRSNAVPLKVNTAPRVLVEVRPLGVLLVSSQFVITDENRHYKSNRKAGGAVK